MKAVLSILLLVSVAIAQEPVCFVGDGGQVVPIACDKIPGKDQFRELPPKRSWSDRHRTALILGGVAFGVAAGVIIRYRVNNPHCDHYPPGYTGVGVNCPVPDGK